MLPGNCVAGAPIRVTIPISWSVEIASGMRLPDVVAERWRPFDSAAICCGVSMLSRLELLK
jgi:hypothetical protein